MSSVIRMMAAAAVVLTGVAGARAEIVMATVPVGNPGNAGELSGAGAGGYGPDRICGAVRYPFEIGTFEVTAGQYTAFLNAVAATDPYALYQPRMADTVTWRGCNIVRSGSPGGYTYSVASDWADRPVNYMTWGSAARFANWMHNEQPVGAPGLTTTEDGSYLLDGAVSDAELFAVTRQADATWVIPSEDEWYKAAYYHGVAGAYFNYPTGTDVTPSHDLINPDPGNNANFTISGPVPDYTIGNPYYRTVVGEFENSASPYGTFDQGGNLWEWDEAIIDGLRGVRGGSYDSVDWYMQASRRYVGNQTLGSDWIGFRVALVPDPATLGLLAVGAVMVIGRRRR